ncbi:hypothetical protein [Synechococcus sp. MIT S9507]|uniref:hypothetical protein n=1 Tax=Synechococcus sp. MIT S9507 TaxID=3082544 RepID=UPI0039B63CE5
MLSNIHFIIPLLSFLKETIPKLTRKTSETVIRTAALSSLISRLPNDSVVKIELFIQGFRAFLPWGLGQESKASFRRERSDRQTVKTKSNPASFSTIFFNFSFGFRVGVSLLWPLINTQYRCIRFNLGIVAFAICFHRRARQHCLDRAVDRDELAGCNQTKGAG